MLFRKGKKRRLSFSPPFFAPSKKPVPEVSVPEGRVENTAAPQIDLTSFKAVAHVDIYSESRIAGWSYYADHTDIPVELNFYFDEKLVGTTTATGIRSDVKEAGHETDRCGFLFTPAAEAFANCRTIEVRASNGQTIGKYPS